MNEKLTKDRMLYECDTMRAKLNYEIEAAERQLSSAQKRILALKYDLYIYSAFILLPFFLFGIMSLLPGRMNIIGVIFELILTILILFSFFMLPLNIYHFIKTYMLIQLNKETNSDVILPPLKGPLSTPHKIYQEKSFRAEYNKLVAVLTRYYLNLEALDQLEKQIKSENCTMSMATLKVELIKLPFYEDVRPADTFSGAMAKKAAKISRIVFLTLIGIIILIIALL